MPGIVELLACQKKAFQENPIHDTTTDRETQCDQACNQQEIH